MIDLIQLSNTDPIWVTIALIAARVVTLSVVSVWVGVMAWRQVRGARRPSLPLSWSWTLIGWMFAVAVQLVVSVSRVLIVRHVRTGDQIGEYFRMVEIASAVHLGCWSIIAFWRWAHPLQSVSSEGVFASLATSMSMIVSDNTGKIVYATPAFNGLAGYAGDELIGANLDTIIPAHLRDAHRAGMRRFLSTGESRIIGQVVPLDLLRKDGTELPIYLALATSMVDGQPWFCGSAWRQTGAIERQQSERSVRQDEQQVVLDKTSLINTERGKYLSEAGVVLDNRRIEMNDEQTVMDERGHSQDERQIEQDGRGQEQDECVEEQVHQDLTIGDVIKQTAEDVQVVKQDIQVVKRKIVEGEDES